MPPLQPVTRALLLINVAVFFLARLFGGPTGDAAAARAAEEPG